MERYKWREDEKRRHKQLLDNLKKTIRLCKLKYEIIDRTLWKISFGRGYGSVIKYSLREMKYIAFPSFTPTVNYVATSLSPAMLIVTYDVLSVSPVMRTGNCTILNVSCVMHIVHCGILLCCRNQLIMSSLTRLTTSILEVILVTKRAGRTRTPKGRTSSCFLTGVSRL